MRKFLANTTALGRRFKNDEKGVTALSFALALTVLLGAIGAGMDVSVANKSKNRAQQIADSVALNAAAFWRENERAPRWRERKEAFRHNKWYKASDFGYDFGALTWDDVYFKVRYIRRSEEARVIITGRSRTTFTNFLGIRSIRFRAQSTAHFESDKLIAPVSVAFIADNSGSMHFDDKPTVIDNSDPDDPEFTIPDNPAPRIDGLKNAARSFMAKLEETSGDQDSSHGRTVRTGLLPYSADILNQNRVDMTWGFLSDSDINDMEPDGSTNSAPPMRLAEEWMDSEDATHMSETGKKPLRFIVFLTDGMNTTTTWVPEDNTHYFRKKNCGWYTNPDRYCNWNGWYRNNGGQWKRRSREWFLNRNWDEGSYQMLADQQTMEVCDRLRTKGVRVFTIAFALQAGQYYVGDWAGGAWDDGQRDYDREEIDNYYETTSDAASKATGLMQHCATNPGDFVMADNNESLQAAFDEIGAKIEKEVIRLAH